MRFSTFANSAFVSALTAAVVAACGGSECAEEMCFTPSESGAAGATGTGASGGTLGKAGNGGFGDAGHGEAAGTAGSSGTFGGGGSTAAGGAAGDAGEHDGGAAADAGSSAVGGEAGATNDGPCALDAEPHTERCLVADDRAVFVAPSGDDTASGSRTAPLASVAAAVERARDEDKIVVVCAKTFAEPLTLSDLDDADGTRIYGGFDCDADWEPTDQASVFAPESGPALRLDSIEGPLLLSGFEFRAADATEPGESSIAAIVKDVEDVSFDTVRFVAGNGMDGADGDPIPAYEESAVPGNDASGAVGGSTRDTCACPESVGGRGGSATSSTNPNPPTAGLPDLGGGSAGKNESCSGPGTGGDGNNGSNGSSGAGANTHGSLDSQNLLWTPASGQPGAPGSVGQGGGGGRGGETGGGGGGACGGCGGKGGQPGQGGGASVGLLILRSTLTFNKTTIELGNAGNGGDGAPGQEGQKGGVGGVQQPPGCSGGNGGNGGNGGHGGGGAGGIVVALLHTAGTFRGFDALTIHSGSAGNGGQGEPNNDVSRGIDGDTYGMLGVQP